MKRTRLIDFYLSQDHPIPDNNEWWGPGFNEWRKVAFTKPLHKNHHPAKIPGQSGLYDLRLHETRLAQTRLAKEYGIEGFCYLDHWLFGKQRPKRMFNVVFNGVSLDFTVLHGVRKCRGPEKTLLRIWRDLLVSAPN